MYCLFSLPRLEKTHMCRFILVHDEMWRVEREFFFFGGGRGQKPMPRILLFPQLITVFHPFFFTEAVQRITGAYVAFMRPPYGNYNQMVLDASGIRGQGVVIWDFELVSSSFFFFLFFSQLFLLTDAKLC